MRVKVKVIIFGLGNYYQIQKPKLQSFPDVEIVAFADNNTALWGNFFDGRRVIPPVEILAETFDQIIIVSLYVAEIFQQLTALGVGEEKIVSWPHFWSERMKGRIEIFSPEGEQWDRDQKALIITNDLNYGGASLAAVYAAEALNAHWSVALAVPAGNQKLIQEVVKSGITVAVCSALPFLGVVEEKWIRQFNVVIVNSFPMIESVLAVRRFCPVLWWLHEPSGNYPIVRQQFIDDFPEKEFQGICVCAVSEIAAQPFQESFPDAALSILPLGIPDRRKQEAVDRRHKKMVFAVIGGVTSAKGQDIFLEAASTIESGQAEFWLIGQMGNTEYCRKIKEKAEQMKSVRIWGELSRGEMDTVFPEIDVVVCTSWEETLSIAVIEGMMFEKICITTKHTGIADYIEEGKNGFITDYGDVNQLREKMELVLEKGDSLNSMRWKARQTYERWFDMEAFADRMNDMVDRL